MCHQLPRLGYSHQLCPRDRDRNPRPCMVRPESFTFCGPQRLRVDENMWVIPLSHWARMWFFFLINTQVTLLNHQASWLPNSCVTGVPTKGSCNVGANFSCSFMSNSLRRIAVPGSLSSYVHRSGGARLEKLFWLFIVIQWGGCTGGK
jgi:hypothetical protein